jgi:hypothetical protein
MAKKNLGRSCQNTEQSAYKIRLTPVDMRDTTS